MRDAWPSGLRNRSSRELLQLYAATLSILLERGVIRTRNAPAGDLAERLVADAYGAHLLPNSVKSYDVLTQDGQRIQVKCRVLESTKGSQTYSVFRSWEFDRCVFVRFDPVTYDVLDAVDVPVTSVKPIAKHVAWVKGDRVAVAAPLLSLPDARDVSQDLQAALERLDSAPDRNRPEPPSPCRSAPPDSPPRPRRSGSRAACSPAPSATHLVPASNSTPGTRSGRGSASADSPATRPPTAGRAVPSPMTRR